MKNLAMLLIILLLLGVLSFVAYYINSEGILTIADVEAFFQGAIDLIKGTEEVTPTV